MKFDDHLAQYLYENKSLRLQAIGTFTLDGKVSLPHAQEKEIYYPIEGLAFTYNPKEILDETLITFLVKRLGKIQPLVRSDLDSYLSNIKQFINLGKPYTIEGIGTLAKNNKGLYEFTPGNFLPAKEELNPRRENAEHNYPTSSKNSAAKVLIIILIILASLAALGGIGWGISTLMSKKMNDNNDQQQQQGQSDTLTPPQEETQPAIVPKETEKPQDTVAKPATLTVPATTDTEQYKMIFEVTKSRARAVSRTTKLTEVYHMRSVYDSLTNASGTTYRLYVPAIPAKDTIHFKDSLKRFFGKPIMVEKQ